MTEYVKRSEPFLAAVNYLVGRIMKRTANIHVDMPQETREYIKNHSVMYMSLHKSLWETIGIPYTLRNMGMTTPYVVMGNNLVKGKAFVYAMKKMGVVVSKRVQGKVNGVTEIQQKSDAAYGLINTIDDLLEHGDSVLIFPENGRSKNGKVKPFKSVPFEAALATGSALIPVDVDYSYLNEEEEFSKSEGTYTFKAHHFRRWFKHLGDIYISFGTPINAIGHRKDLTQITRSACMDLVKIQPINVVSYAMAQPGDLRENIKDTLDRLSPQSHKFIGFTADDSIESILSKIDIDMNQPKLYTPYAGYISHYIEPPKA
jgi:1-acyl-sn-glycerol-3-phosphate acyltransferase